MASASNECQPLPLSRAKPLTRLALAEIAVYVAIGPQAVTITLSATCDTSGARRMPSHQPQTRRFERPPTLRPLFTELRFYTFPGGCAMYWFHFARDASPLLARSVDRGGLHAAGQAGGIHRKNRGSGTMRAGCALPRMSRPTAARQAHRFRGPAVQQEP